MNYKGRFVFTIKAESESQYGAGEHFVLDETPFGLIAVKPGSGYDFSHLVNLPKAGKERHQVQDARRDDSAARALAARMLDFAAEVDKPNKNWVDNVYLQARSHARMVLKAIGDDPELVVGESTTVTVGPNTKTLVIQFQK